MADDVDYLQPSFEPSSVTMPVLRNILMSNSIHYPASAKKADLVDIFNQRLRPKTRKLLAAREHVRRTSAGITNNIPSSQDSNTVSADEDDHRSSTPPPDTPKDRNFGRHTHPEPKATESATRPTSTAQTIKRPSSKPSRHSGANPEPELPRPAARKSRKSELTPTIKQEHLSLPDSTKASKSKGAFSDDNPFQSGSSPSEGEPQRRQSGSSAPERRKSSSNKTNAGEKRAIRSTGDAVRPVVPAPQTYQMAEPAPKKSRVKAEVASDIEVGEEFTPEEQLEMSSEQTASRSKGRSSSNRIHEWQRTKTVSKSIPWMAVGLFMFGYATWYRQEQLAVGYCGIGRPPDAIAAIKVPGWASSLVPDCQACPSHATCYEGMRTICDHDYVLQTHPLSLGSLIPIPPICAPDGEKARKVKAVADRAVEELRERKAEAECGTLKDEKGDRAPAEISERKLKATVGQQRRRGMTAMEFEDLWKGAIGDIVSREEIVQSTDQTHLASTSFARLPLKCAIRRSARLALARYRGAISLVVGLLASLVYARNRILQNRADAARVPTLVGTTLDRLATQAALYSRGDASESWVSVGQLRDDVLREEFSDRRRESMWARVRAVVEKNANVRASSRELRGGDVSRVWEWIGSLALLDDPGFSGRRSGGKSVSWEDMVDEGADAGETSGASRNGPVNKTMQDSTMPTENETRKWDDGRPIY